VVTHPLWVQEVSGSIPGSGNGFYVSFFCFAVVVFLLFCVKNTLFVTKVCNSFYLSQKFAIPFTMLIYLVYLTYCNICDLL